MNKKTVSVSNPKNVCLQINLLCQTKAATKKVSTANLGMILKVAIEKVNCQSSTDKQPVKNKTALPCGMKLKTAYKKVRAAAGEKSKGFKSLSNPTATKN